MAGRGGSVSGILEAARSFVCGRGLEGVSAGNVLHGQFLGHFRLRFDPYVGVWRRDPAQVQFVFVWGILFVVYRFLSLS